MSQHVRHQSLRQEISVPGVLKPPLAIVRADASVSLPWPIPLHMKHMKYIPAIHRVASEGVSYGMFCSNFRWGGRLDK